MSDRRTFIKQVSGAGVVSVLPASMVSAVKPVDNKIWGALLHLSFNMWEEYISPHRPFRGYRPFLRLSESLWNDALKRMAAAKLNLVIIDLGDGIKYRSHPEIAVEKAWSVETLKQELKKMRDLGLEPIPKLNCSAGHDTWMKKYSRMVSTDAYYSFCRDIIAEVVDIFDSPRFFHLGMDEETAGAQSHYRYTVVRKDDLWWGDFYYLIGEVERHGVRPWIWSDYMWSNPELFFKEMPKSVVQSNWYYGERFDGGLSESAKRAVDAYVDLEKGGYDQVPTGSFHDNNTRSIGNTVKFCQSHVNDGRLMGFLQTFWKPTIEEYRDLILKGIDLAGEARKWYYNNPV